MRLRKTFENETELREWILQNEAVLKKLYFDKNLTARKVAENQNVEFNQRFAKLLSRHLGRKGMGRGGARPGSGNKKGVKFCGKCRQLKYNCICTIN